MDNCGNFKVDKEAGEQCDCGDSTSCMGDKCCQRTGCQFINKKSTCRWVRETFIKYVVQRWLKFMWFVNTFLIHSKARHSQYCFPYSRQSYGTTYLINFFAVLWMGHVVTLLEKTIMMQECVVHTWTTMLPMKFSVQMILTVKSRSIAWPATIYVQSVSTHIICYKC